MKKIIVLLVLSITFLSSCSSDDSVDKIEVTDMLGETTMVVKSPKKVACVSRAVCDLIISFGAGENLDGVYKTVLSNDWLELIYPENSDLKSYEYEESKEVFYSREIDLIISPEKRITDDLKASNLPAITVNHYGNPTFDDYMNYIADLTILLWGDNEVIVNKAVKWKEDVSKAINDITSKLLENNVVDEGKTIYYVRGDKNNGIGYTETSKPFLEYIYRLFKYENIGQRFQTNKPSDEEILNINPDVIVFGGIYQHQNFELLDSEPWINLSSYKNDNLFKIPIGISSFEQISAMTNIFIYQQANALYPEIFNYDILPMIKEAYKFYYDFDLSDVQINYMIEGKKTDGTSWE